ncbi:MAG: alpha/beta hydrolase [Chitinophaga sp.]|uniref:alpha/beta fold hydrolase n=1 Tax=Chitinophaga sp. TaxID=1869181 RepID=UPI001B0859B8|nr:alpha/beta hydrolase [Chitinophaga sp.]MBO9732102.1 alpha/beta hydrolase [Chitinophaga sp.]
MTTFKTNTATSAKGGMITYDTIGNGPGLIIVHGALSDIEEYTDLAIALSGNFTVHLMQRRDRHGQEAHYNIKDDCNDVMAVQQATGATFLFGHSYGGLVALEAAVNGHPFKKISVYEPGVSLHGNWKWLNSYETAMAHQQYRKAFTVFVQGMGHSPLSNAPSWLAGFVLRLAIKGKKWELKKRLLASNFREHLEVKRLEGSYRKYESLSVPVLLMGGKASPGFISDTLNVLKQTIPRAEVLLLPALHHLSPTNNEAPAIVAENLLTFFKE